MLFINQLENTCFLSDEVRRFLTSTNDTVSFCEKTDSGNNNKKIEKMIVLMAFRFLQR